MIFVGLIQGFHLIKYKSNLISIAIIICVKSIKFSLLKKVIVRNQSVEKLDLHRGIEESLHFLEYHNRIQESALSTMLHNATDDTVNNHGTL